MLSFEHTNVMSLIGVCIDREMPLLIMPFMINGSILHYVKRHKEKLLSVNECAKEKVCNYSYNNTFRDHFMILDGRSP